MQFISNFYAIYFQFLCNLFSNFYATYLQFLCNLAVKKYVLWKVNFDGTLKKANRVCSLTLSLCCAILVLLSFNSVHTDCCTSKAFSTKYQKRKRKREIQLFPMLWYLISYQKNTRISSFFQFDKIPSFTSCITLFLTIFFRWVCIDVEEGQKSNGSWELIDENKWQ